MSDKETRQEEDANKKYYFTIVDKKLRPETYRKLISEMCEFQIWQRGQSENKVEQYEPVEYREDQNAIVLKQKGSLLAMFKKSTLVDKKIFIKTKFEKFQYFSTGTLEYAPENDLYHIVMSNDLYVSQRRNDYRLTANKYNVMKIKIDGSIFDCLDLSSGGTSFFIAEEDKARFTKGKEFSGCTVNFDKINYDIPKVRIAASFEKPDPRDGKTKTALGVQFLDLSSDMDEKLCKHVNTEARAEEIRKNLLNKKK